ncbi:MAG TPA: phosphatidylserine/phosphatidylglycerophosphate/cardiolipin synthase family protein [Candidatus Wallbacteria bacterium]|nr:phosphatidylserine/phosphatidylglycerophosphate/cardiolipin synthase family protein [Candidatus Wallbacteria bacterium]
MKKLTIMAAAVLLLVLSLTIPAFSADDQNLTTVSIFDELARQSGNQTAQARLITDNNEAWYARWNILFNAKTSIDMTYFIVEKDVFGMSMLGLLLQKAKEGVKVRIMFDARGTKSLTRTMMGQDYLQELIGVPNVEIHVYNPISENILSAVGNLRNLTGANHDKIIIVDGETVITGGRNISMNYFVDPGDVGTVYRDTDVLLRGAGVAKQIKLAFDEEFNSHMAFVIKRDLLGNWVSRAEDLDLARRTMGRFIGGMGVVDPKTLKHNKSLASYAEELSKYKHMQSYLSYAPFSGLHSYPTIILDKHSFKGTRNDITPALTAMIRHAKKEVIIQNPYVVLTPEARAAIKEASDRGISVIIHTNSPVSSDSLLTQAFFLEDWDKILKDMPNVKLYAFKGERKLHSKTFVFDREITVIGTYNMDYVSEQINSEVVAAVKSTDFAQRTALRIAEDIKQSVEYKITVNADGSVTKDFSPETHSSPEKIKTLNRLRQLGFLRPLI